MAGSFFLLGLQKIYFKTLERFTGPKPTRMEGINEILFEHAMYEDRNKKQQFSKVWQDIYDAL